MRLQIYTRLLIDLIDCVSTYWHQPEHLTTNQTMLLLYRSIWAPYLQYYSICDWPDLTLCINLRRITSNSIKGVQRGTPRNKTYLNFFAWYYHRIKIQQNKINIKFITIKFYSLAFIRGIFSVLTEVLWCRILYIIIAITAIIIITNATTATVVPATIPTNWFLSCWSSLFWLELSDPCA